MLIGYFADGKWAHNALELIISSVDIDIAFICARYENPDQILFQKAKNLGVVTPKEYISNIKKNQISQASFKSTSEILLKSITKLYNQIDAFKDNEIKNLKPVNQLKRELNLTFYILVYLEILLFLMVALIDLINNNADAKDTYFINFKIKLKQKVKPLFISFLFVFFGIISGQKLLSYEKKSFGYG